MDKKIKYQQVENYELIKDAFLEKIKTMKGKIPEGFDNDIFLSAFIKIYDYLTKKYKDIKLKKSDIPDIERFEQRETYNVGQFIFNRIINNIDKVEIQEVDKDGASGGRYRAMDKSLEIFKATIESNNEKQFEKYKNLNFASQKDFNKIVTEYFIIHELIHAISFDDFTVGFRTNDQSVSMNEGFTDSLALEISGFGQFYQYLPQKVEDGRYCMIPRNSVSSYTVETNIADLVRIVAKEDLTLPYLISGHTTKWKHINSYDKSCYPLKENEEVFNFLAQELYNITNEESKLTNQQRIENLQNLQGYLIKDIVKNKYNQQYIENVQNNNVSYDQVMQLIQDVVMVANKIVLSFPEETANQIMFYGANSLQICDLTKVKQQIKQGKIENSENIKCYIELMERYNQLIDILQKKKEEGLTL